MRRKVKVKQDKKEEKKEQQKPKKKKHHHSSKVETHPVCSSFFPTKLPFPLFFPISFTTILAPLVTLSTIFPLPFIPFLSRPLSLSFPRRKKERKKGRETVGYCFYYASSFLSFEARYYAPYRAFHFNNTPFLLRQKLKLK